MTIYRFLLMYLATFFKFLTNVSRVLTSWPLYSSFLDVVSRSGLINVLRFLAMALKTFFDSVSFWMLSRMVELTVSKISLEVAPSGMFPDGASWTTGWGTTQKVLLV